MLTKMFTLLAVIVATLSLTAAVRAADPARAEYSADQVMEHSEGASKGRVYVAPGKERRETSEGGQNMLNITRYDKKVTWMLMSEDKMYMETKHTAATQSKDDLSEYQIEQSVVGTEKMNGVETTKSKIIMTGKDGSKMGGFMWTTKEGIQVKLDAIAIDKNSKDRFKMELTNIKISKQDPALFEIPKGYEKMDMPGMDMETMKKMMKQ